MTSARAMSEANPVRREELRLIVSQEWSDRTLSEILRAPRSAPSSRLALARRLVVVALLVAAALSIPAWAIGRAVTGWLEAEPAPQSVVDNFDSYAPQLGFSPKSGKAVRVAADGSFVLYATTNDRGSYCVATSTPDGGICVRPSVAALPLIAGIMPGDPGRADARGITLVAGRVTQPSAVAISFTDPDGVAVRRSLGAGGFFLAALRDGSSANGPPSCRNGDWKPIFHALAADGSVVLSAAITLAARPVGAPRGVGCGWANGPHSY